MKHILRLKEFYLLELFQLTLYESQMGALQNEYIKHCYERMIELERHHVDFYKEIIAKYDEEVPTISGGLTSLAGHILGDIALDLTTDENRYKLGIAVEKKAIEMYRTFIAENWEFPDIQKKAWHNMIDEEFHSLWFEDKLNHITSLS